MATHGHTGNPCNICGFPLQGIDAIEFLNKQASIPTLISIIKTKEEILKRYIETPFRHTQIVDKDNALLAMEEYVMPFKLENEELKKEVERLKDFEFRYNSLNH